MRLGVNDLIIRNKIYTCGTHRILVRYQNGTRGSRGESLAILQTLPFRFKSRIRNICGCATCLDLCLCCLCFFIDSRKVCHVSLVIRNEALIRSWRQRVIRRPLCGILQCLEYRGTIRCKIQRIVWRQWASVAYFWLV